ncbi:hypothetical protein ANMWB30_24540 [Arthrobacter sp. MWB30]|nr:hypothetical protein ANMWB30_24540 [Arthrobacter sp. MWB30]
MASWKRITQNLTTYVKSELPWLLDDIRYTGTTALLIVGPIGLVASATLFMWLNGGHRIAELLIKALIDSYRVNPQDTVLHFGTEVLVITLALYALRRTLRVLNSRHARRYAGFRQDPSMQMQGHERRDPVAMTLEPMPREMQIVKQKYGRDVAEYAIAISTPGDSLDDIMARAENAVLGHRPLTLDDIARHEAAHTIAAYAMGATPISAHIEGVERGGQARYINPAAGSKPQDDLWISLIVSVAGHFADRAQGRSNAGSHQDLSKVDRLIYSIISTGVHPDGYSGDLDASSLLNAARNQAGSILEDHSRKYDKLAAELLKHRRLNSHQIRGILADPDAHNETPCPEP